MARMLKAGFTGSEIARTIGKDPSAVNRHIKQNGGRDGYDVREVRRQKHHKSIAAMDGIRVLKGMPLRTVTSLLKEHYSPCLFIHIFNPATPVNVLLLITYMHFSEVLYRRPVSYTHLDVYKRQLPGRTDSHVDRKDDYEYESRAVNMVLL